MTGGGQVGDAPGKSSGTSFAAEAAEAEAAAEDDADVTLAVPTLSEGGWRLQARSPRVESVMTRGVRMGTLFTS